MDFAKSNAIQQNKSPIFKQHYGKTMRNSPRIIQNIFCSVSDVSVLLSSEKYGSTGKVLLVGLKVDIRT